MTTLSTGYTGDVYGLCSKCGNYAWAKDASPRVCNKCAGDVTCPYNATPQVGGTHYSKLAIDPYEYAHRNGLGMLQGNVVKYVTRYKDKNGKEDLEKAMNTLQRLIDMEYPG